MANRVKTISKYSGSAWGTEVPIGADATNVDMTTAPSDYDSSTSETSKVLIGTNDVKAIASDTDLTAWGKFNRFRRRVSNKFADYFATANLTGSSAGVTSTGDDSHAYTTAALNAYFSTVVGYSSAADVSEVGSVASQLSSLNSKISHIGMIIYSTTLDTEIKVIEIYGGTTWTRITGKFLLGATDGGSTGTGIKKTASVAPGGSGGEATHTLTSGELATHHHSFSANSTMRNLYTNTPIFGGGTNTSVKANNGSWSGDYMAGGGGQSKVSTFYISGNTGDAGSGTSHNIMPPFLAVYIWERTA